MIISSAPPVDDQTEVRRATPDELPDVLALLAQLRNGRAQPLVGKQLASIFAEILPHRRGRSL